MLMGDEWCWCPANKEEMRAWCDAAIAITRAKVRP
jgi:hypothetical protein